MAARVGSEVSTDPSRLQGQQTFSIGLYEIGRCSSCMFSYCCTPCAFAQARSKLDGSSCWFNTFFVPAPVTRWFIRSAYNIEGSEVNDILTTCCFTPCAANQLLQTVETIGIPTPNSGARYNNNNWKTRTDEACLTTIFNCLYATFCPHCATANALSTAFDMPFWFGCLCMNPCVGTNFIRYQYRIDGDDVFEDCLSVACWPFTINAVMKLLTETNHMVKQQGWPKRYLAPAPGAAVSGVNGVATSNITPMVVVHSPQLMPAATNGGVLPQAQVVMTDFKPQPVYASTPTPVFPQTQPQVVIQQSPQQPQPVQQQVNPQMVAQPQSVGPMPVDTSPVVVASHPGGYGYQVTSNH